MRDEPKTLSVSDAVATAIASAVVFSPFSMHDFAGLVDKLWDHCQSFRGVDNDLEFIGEAAETGGDMLEWCILVRGAAPAAGYEIYRRDEHPKRPDDAAIYPWGYQPRGYEGDGYLRYRFASLECAIRATHEAAAMFRSGKW